jgi:glycosyltransferase involved in cell wall biosynthesis
LCEDLARRGRERVPLFSWESTLAKTWEIYQELAGTVASPD